MFGCLILQMPGFNIFIESYAMALYFGVPLTEDVCGQCSDSLASIGRVRDWLWLMAALSVPNAAHIRDIGRCLLPSGG